MSDVQHHRRRNLESVRARLGITVTEIARRMGVTAGYVSQLKHARTPFYEDTARNIENALSLRPGALDVETN